MMSLIGQRNIEQTDKSLSQSLERLSSGLRINSAADDPAGLVISQQLRAQTASLQQAQENSQNASNLVGTADAAMNEVSNLLIGIRQAAVFAMNTGGTSSDQIAAEQDANPQGTAVGTPHFISPEQARGLHDLDGKADLYSLGATLYYLLTGKTMFSGSTHLVVMTRHITDRCPSPAEAVAEASKGMVAILAKLLTKDRADRYESAEQLASDMALVAQGKPPQQHHLERALGTMAVVIFPVAVSTDRTRPSTRQSHCTYNRLPIRQGDEEKP
jgi:serine/threonine protein kinase